MLVYMLYEAIIYDGEDELWEYFSFCFFSFFALIVDLIIFPIEILAFILWKLRRDK